VTNSKKQMLFLLGVVVLTAASYVAAAPQFSNENESVDYETFFTVSNTDIGDVSQGASTRFDGGIGPDYGTNDAAMIDGLMAECCPLGSVLIPSAESTLEIFLDTSVNTGGYNITRLVNTTGWNGSSRTNHQYVVALRSVGGDYVDLIDVQYPQPTDPGYPNSIPVAVENPGVQLTIDDDMGGLLGSGIDAVRYTFNNINAGTSGEAFQEFDVFGTPGEALPPATTYAWRLPGLGNWHDGASWNAVNGPGSFPNGAGHTAQFGGGTDGGTAVVDKPVLINHIEFNSANKYAIAGLGGVTLAADPTGPTDPSIAVQLGDHTFQTPVSVDSDATVTVAAGAELSFDNKVYLNGNTLSLSGDAMLNHSVVGSGTVAASGTLGTEGDTTIVANLSLASATVDLDLRDSSGGATSDRFNVEGSATLTGNITVNVDLVDGYSPGSDVAILTTTGGIVDNSLSLSLTGPGQAAFTGVGVVGNNLVLQVGVGGTLEGDYNSDGVVNAADYTLWADNLGTNNPLANDTIGGQITEAHYLQWKNNFGNVQSSASGGAVPEPVSLVLSLVGVLFCFASGRQRLPR
jgi:hypothetical protein